MDGLVSARTHLLPVIDRVLEEGRRAVEDLRSPNGLPALEQAFAAAPKDLGLSPSVGFRVVILGRQRGLRPGVRHEVYRIGCEAIVNAYRHSRAKNIEVEFEYRPNGLRISVRDNGCGIAAEGLQWEHNGHWGLQGMRERAERIGGRLRLLSRVGLGTEVELSIPGRILV